MHDYGILTSVTSSVGCRQKSRRTLHGAASFVRGHDVGDKTESVTKSICLFQRKHDHAAKQVARTQRECFALSQPTVVYISLFVTVGGGGAHLKNLTRINNIYMEWNNLQRGLCPKCEELLVQRRDQIVCTVCEFFMNYGKYLELSKGKNSKYYQRAISRKLKNNRKSRENLAYQAQMKAKWG